MAGKNTNEVLRQLTYGIYVVTVGLERGATALTISWLTEVSFEPPLVAMAIGRDRFCNRVLRKGKKFTVNFLSEDQGKVAAQFASESEGDRLSEVPVVEPQTTGAPVLADALAYLDCQVTDIVETGDHTLFVGKVVGGEVLREGTPLCTANSSLRYRKP